MRALAFLLLASCTYAQSMSVHINNGGSFIPGPGGGGTITGVVDLKTEVQFPENTRTVVVGGHDKGANVTTSRGGNSSIIDNGGGGYSSITVTPVPAITGPEERPLTGVPGRELLTLLTSADPSDRLSAAAEIGRRPWNPKARRVLSRNLATRLGDEAPRVAGAAAHALAALRDPEAPSLIVPYLRGRDSDRLVPMIEALGDLADPRTVPHLEKLHNHIDLAISLAAGKALTTLERRQRAAQAKAPPVPPAPLGR